MLVLLSPLNACHFLKPILPKVGWFAGERNQNLNIVVARVSCQALIVLYTLYITSTSHIRYKTSWLFLSKQEIAVLIHKQVLGSYSVIFPRGYFILQFLKLASITK